MPLRKLPVPERRPVIASSTFQGITTLRSTTPTRERLSLFTPPTGGDPMEFFEQWLAHGTGGTCFAVSGGIHALLRAIGFDANRISGSMILEGLEQDGNHASALVSLEGIDYLVDPQLASFVALPLLFGQSTSAGAGIHAIHAIGWTARARSTARSRALGAHLSRSWWKLLQFFSIQSDLPVEDFLMKQLRQHSVLT